MYFWSPSCLKTSSKLAEENGEEGVQETTRPSVFVRPLNFVGLSAFAAVAGCKVRVTGMFGPGRPRVVSRTWQVIGGFFSVDMLGVDVEC